MILMILGAASYTIGILAAGWYGGYVGLIAAITAAAGTHRILCEAKFRQRTRIHWMPAFRWSRLRVGEKA